MQKICVKKILMLSLQTVICDCLEARTTRWLASYRDNLPVSFNLKFFCMSAIDIAYEVGKSIVTDKNVVNTTQALISATLSGGVQIAGAAVTGGSVGATASTVGTSIGVAATNVGQAVMGTKAVSLFMTFLASPAAPFVIGTAAIGGLIWLIKNRLNPL